MRTIPACPHASFVPPLIHLGKIGRLQSLRGRSFVAPRFLCVFACGAVRTAVWLLRSFRCSSPSLLFPAGVDQGEAGAEGRTIRAMVRIIRHLRHVQRPAPKARLQAFDGEIHRPSTGTRATGGPASRRERLVVEEFVQVTRLF